MKIPLVRPELPYPSEWLGFLKPAYEEHRFSNFGHCFELASELLDSETEKLSLPVTNATLGIAIALQTIFPRGSTIAIPDYTFIGTLNAVYLAGMKPYLLPCDTSTWAIDLEFLYDYRNKYDGFIVVSPFGYFVNHLVYDQFAHQYQKPIVYDFAAGFGMFPKTKHPIVYSFHSTKNCAAGEGGAICFEEADQLDKAKSLINFHFDKTRTPSSAYGMNAKMDEIRCAILAAQLKSGKWKDRVFNKKHLLDDYNVFLIDRINPFFLHDKSSPSFCVVNTPFASKSEQLGQANGIETKRYYRPLLSENPSLSHVDRAEDIRRPFFNNCLALPSDITPDELKTVVRFIKSL